MSSKTFYLETFGCQMNVHDSEKVVGTLLQEGYRQVETVEEADLVLYNTCSIRDKAEQKVFNRLSDYKKYKKQGKTFGVLGCVAQQEGEKIFERAPYVSLVAGSASYHKLPQMLKQLEEAESRSAASSIAISPTTEAAPPFAVFEGWESMLPTANDSSVGKPAGKPAVKSSGQKPIADSLVRI